jgi:uncharacterized protein (DUF433 family)
MPQNTTGVTTNGLTTVTLTAPEMHEATGWGGVLTKTRTVALSSAVLQHERILVDPNILNGEPYVRGTRIPIAVILDGLAEQLTPEALIEHYPRLTLEDIRAALEYAAAMSLSPTE